MLQKNALEVLVCEEQIGGEVIIKFPGGGLELGEGTIQCLQREFQEELGAEISVIEHFYTTDFYQKSAWDDSQVISIYYLVQFKSNIEFPYNNGKELCYFYPIALLKDVVSLPIDLAVVQKLEVQYSK